MSNHYHLVVYVDQQRAEQLTERQVVDRWTQIFGAPLQVTRYLSGEAAEAEAELARSMILLWRMRLHDISWFMKRLNEYLTRRANAEDQCTGKFWEGRFKSQALVDEAGLLTAMAYVDLNPIRAERIRRHSIASRRLYAKPADPARAMDECPGRPGKIFNESQCVA